MVHCESKARVRLLLVEDDEAGQMSTRRILEREGYTVLVANHGQEALALLRESQVSLIVTDIRMPQMDGLELIKAAAWVAPQTPFIVMTAFGSVDQAVWAMKFGAVDFLSKPFKKSALIEAVERALQKKGAQALVSASSSVNSRQKGGKGFYFGTSPGMLALHEQIRKVAASSSSVLVSGESGTGKEGVSRLLHDWSPRAERPWVAVNCAALPSHLVESELFGHEKGAFTGAVSARAGLFEVAHTGTLLLDEVGELPLDAQAKLLRVLQESEVRRIGSAHSRKVDVRVVASTHRDLRKQVEQGAFREDLFFRLEVIRLEVPPLRARLQDLPELGSLLLSHMGQAQKKLSRAALDALMGYDWPGNIREFSNVLERAAVLSDGDEIHCEDLPEAIQGCAKEISQVESKSREVRARERVASDRVIEVKLGTPLKEIEDLLIQRTLELTDGDKAMTARLLGINSRTIYRKLATQSVPVPLSAPGEFLEADESNVGTLEGC